MKTFATTRRPASLRSPVRRSASPPLRSAAESAVVRNVLHGPRLQPKLTVGPPDDAYEREADRVADAVMRMPEPKGRIQRLCPECEEEMQRQPAPEKEEEEEEEKKLQRKETPGQVPDATPDLESRIAALQGGGDPLPSSEWAFFEPRFGRAFGDVRIHSGLEAADLAQRVHARAFTLGRSVVFGKGEDRPGTEAGRRLLAHELPHVVQQSRDSSPVVSPKVLQRREVCDENGVCRSEPGPEESALEPLGDVSLPQSGAATPQVIAAVGSALVPSGDCTPVEHAALQAEVKEYCDRNRSCRATDSCPDLLEKISNNQGCIQARVKINTKCFKGGDPGHITAVQYAVNSLANCWLIYQSKCQQQPLTVPEPVQSPQTAPTADRDFLQRMSELTGLTGAALILYLIVSEGSRLFPPRNLIPVP